jgi:hypothetical protein
MASEMHPSVLLQPGAFSLLIAPGERVLRTFLQSPHLRRYLTLYVCGNYSRLLPGIDRSGTQFQIRRAFTGFQLMRILEEAHHTVVWVEHDPTLYDDAGVPTRHIAQAFKSAAERAAVVLYAPEYDAVMREISYRADRLFYLEDSTGLPFHGIAPVPPAQPIRDQTTLEVF